MVINPKLACGLQECVGELWMEGFLADFTVVVQGAEFQCHRLILSACSSFFKGLMRSQMKEAVESCAHLEGMSKDTFEIILNLVYKGLDGLTKDNVIDVWRAVDLLQIQYLIEECEDFILKNISTDNVAEICRHARLLSNMKVISATQKFMIQTFDEIRNMEDVLDLPIEDILILIESHDLNVSSEDNVVEFILKWVSHVPNTGQTFGNKTEFNFELEIQDNYFTNEDIETRDGCRVQVIGNMNSVNSYHMVSQEQKKHFVKQVLQEKDITRANEGRQGYLAKLLSAARLPLASSKCLEQLLTNLLSRSGTEAIALVHKAIFYHLDVERRQGQWPTSAIHRASSNMEHVMIFIDTEFDVQAYSLTNKTFHVCGSIPEDMYYSLAITVHDNILYAEGSNGTEESLPDENSGAKFRLFTCHQQWSRDTLATNIWRSMDSPSQFLPDGNCIIRWSEDVYGLQQYQVGRDKSDFSLASYRDVFVGCVTSLVKFKNLILLFSRGAFRGQTSVRCVDTETKQETSQKSIPGPSDNIISFTDNDDVYIMQRNGVIRKLLSTQSCSLDFQYVGQLWDFDWPIYGAVSFRNQLFVFGSEYSTQRRSDTYKKSLPGIFPEIQIIKINCKTQCLPMIVPKDWLKDLE